MNLFRRNLDEEKKRIEKKTNKALAVIETNTRLLDQVKGLEHLIIIMKKGSHA